jgi:hypothetical protein
MYSIFNIFQLNSGSRRCSYAFWAWTTNQMRHLTEIGRTLSRWIMHRADFQSFNIKKFWGSEIKILPQK